MALSKENIRGYEGGTLFDITVKPDSARCNMRASRKGGIVISVTNPPVKNRANRELVRVLTDLLGVSVEIHRSAKNYHKTMFAAGLSPDELRQRLRITG